MEARDEDGSRKSQVGFIFGDLIQPLHDLIVCGVIPPHLFHRFGGIETINPPDLAGSGEGR
jgi:hypothetical protein